MLGDVERRTCDEEMDEAREREKRAIRCCDLLPASVGAFRSQIEKNEGWEKFFRNSYLIFTVLRIRVAWPFAPPLPKLGTV